MTSRHLVECCLLSPSGRSTATPTEDLSAIPDFEGPGRVILTGAYTDLALNPGITGAIDTVDVNTLASTLDATILTTGTIGQGSGGLDLRDLQNPIFSYAGLYDLGAPRGGPFREILASTFIRQRNTR